MENGASAADLRLVEWLVRMLVVVVADEILPVARGGGINGRTWSVLNISPLFFDWQSSTSMRLSRRSSQNGKRSKCHRLAFVGVAGTHVLVVVVLR